MPVQQRSHAGGAVPCASNSSALFLGSASPSLAVSPPALRSAPCRPPPPRTPPQRWGKQGNRARVLFPFSETARLCFRRKRVLDWALKGTADHPLCSRGWSPPAGASHSNLSHVLVDVIVHLTLGVDCILAHHVDHLEGNVVDDSGRHVSIDESVCELGGDAVFLRGEKTK